MKGLAIGDYVLGTRVGSGGVGDVYRATDSMLEREVAIKFLRPGYGSQPELVQRFRSEARTLAQLHHPNIATLYALHREGDTLAMIMELIDGKTVAALLAEHGKLSLQVAISIFFQALDGIGCAHASGVVHRDIKPSNLMLGRSGVLKVMDFGIARCVGSHRVTRAGNTVGTAQYMSPEQVQGHETDARSDIYSLCVVLYEMLTDRLPFSGDVEYEVMRAQVETPPPPPRSHVPEIPEAVEAAILKGLAKRPGDRFESTDELRDALRDALGDVVPVTASELGGLLLSWTDGAAISLDDEALDTSGGLTELLFAVDEGDELVEPGGAVAQTRSPDDRPSTMVWELPESSPARTGAQPAPPMSRVAPPRSQATAEARCPTPAEPVTHVRSSARTRIDHSPATNARTTGASSTSATRKPSRSLASRALRATLQASALMLVALSVGAPRAPTPVTPGSVSSEPAATFYAPGNLDATARPSSSTSLPSQALALASPPALNERALLRAISHSYLPESWIDAPPLTLLRTDEPGTRTVANRRAPSAEISSRSQTTSRRASAKKAVATKPISKPVNVARKQRATPADEEPGLRSFVQPEGADEIPAASGTGEWVLRR